MLVLVGLLYDFLHSFSSVFSALYSFASEELKSPGFFFSSFFPNSWKSRSTLFNQQIKEVTKVLWGT